MKSSEWGGDSLLPPRDPIKAAYFAGLIDGEGCIRICKARDLRRPPDQIRRYATVEVAMTDEATIQALADYFGGRARPKKVAAQFKPQWRWLATTRRGRQVITEILPYLITKREQAIKVLEEGTPKAINRPRNPLTGRYIHHATNRI